MLVHDSMTCDAYPNIILDQVRVMAVIFSGACGPIQQETDMVQECLRNIMNSKIVSLDSKLLQIASRELQVL